MLKLILQANEEDSTRDLIQDDPSNQEKANLLAQLELSKRMILDSFTNEWEFKEK